MSEPQPLTAEDIVSRLHSLIGLCFTLAHSHDHERGDKQLVGAFFAIGNALEHETAALEAAIAGEDAP